MIILSRWVHIFRHGQTAFQKINLFLKSMHHPISAPSPATDDNLRQWLDCCQLAHGDSSWEEPQEWLPLWVRATRAKERCERHKCFQVILLPANRLLIQLYPKARCTYLNKTHWKPSKVKDGWDKGRFNQEKSSPRVWSVIFGPRLLPAKKKKYRGTCILSIMVLEKPQMVVGILFP